MALLTFGRLELAGQKFPQRQALLLLTYLKIEGRRERSFLAELFWPDAKQPLNNLSSAMSRLRSIDADLIRSDRYTVEANVVTDVDRFLGHASSGRDADALDVYNGRFLDGVSLNHLGAELQEWILDQRASLSGTARDCACRLAQQSFRQGQIGPAVAMAERATSLGRDAIPDPDRMADLLPILRAGKSPQAAMVEADAIELGVEPASLGSTDHLVVASPGRMARAEQQFFGRQGELQLLEEAVEARRAVAITGLGGIGKSELARALIDRIGDRFGPCHTVDARAAETIDHLPEFISHVVFSEENPSSTFRDLAQTIGNRQTVLLLDGFDSLIDDLPTLSELLDGCSGLRLILTTRAEVETHQWFSLSLTGLPSEPVGGGGPGPAVELFQAWFRRQAPLGAELDQGDPAALEICERLHGHPLAIELAAGWLNVLTPQEIAEGLAGRSGDADLLREGETSPSADHAAFQSVMVGTWDLLDEQSRQAITRLSIFPSGFDRSAAEAVGGCSLITLRRLAGWSLISRTGGRYYHCHPLVQSYSRLRLADKPDREHGASQAHAELLLAAVAEAPMVESFETGDPLTAVEDPVANLLTAWEFLIETSAFEALATLADPADRVLSRYGRHLTLLDVFESGSKRLAGIGTQQAAAVHDRLTMHLVWLHLRLGHYGQAKTMADQLLEGSTTAPDIMAEMSRARAAIDRTEGNVGLALERLTTAQQLAGSVSPRMQALVADDIGLCQMILGLYAESRESYGSVLAWARTEGSQPIIARTLLSLGIGYHDAGEILDSLAYLLEAKSIVAVHGLDHLEPFVDVKLARAHLADDDIESARRIIDTARSKASSNWEPWLAVEFDLLSARLAAATGDLDAMWSRLEHALAASIDLDDIPFIAKTYVVMIELGETLDATRSLVANEAALLRSIAKPDSGADYPDRRRAQELIDQLSIGDAGEAKPINDHADQARAFLRRGRLLSQRAR